MENKRHGRSIAREHAIEILYAYAINGVTNKSADDLANEIVANVLSNLDEIDSKIQGNLKRWTMSQINQVNLAILRVATYELLYTDMPSAIIINEALNFTKLYSDVPSKNFVHHVLDNISQI